MSYFIVSDKNETRIKGIFSDEEKIPIENAYLIPYHRRRKSDQGIGDSILCSIDTDNDVLYVFFQNLSDKIENIKLFDSISKAHHYRENNYSYGYIIGLKKDILYENLFECEYLSIKEIH